MKVILKQDHDLLGDDGQIIDVKNGYARNYLIPNGIAIMANKSNLKSHEEITRQRSRKTDKIAADSNKLAITLSGYSFDFKVKAGEDDKLFGSITSQMIHELLEEKGFVTVERKKILLKDPIKSLGEHEVEIKLPQSVIAKIKINVIKESIEPELKVSKTSTDSIIEPEPLVEEVDNAETNSEAKVDEVNLSDDNTEESSEETK
ncbi:MAG: 50S ribosomal protein L9 [Ignavibacteria bacterium]